MDQEQWARVDEFFSQQLDHPDPVLEATLASSAKAGLPPINVAPNQGKFLHLIAKVRGARRILEIGTLAGYSTVWLGRALPKDGVLISLEVNEAHASLARENIKRAGLSHQVSVVAGKADQSLQKLIEAKAEPFDLIFIDADKESNPEYLRLSLRLSRPGTVIICDNVVRQGRVAQADSQDPDVIGVRDFVALLASDSGLSTAVIQTVGSKGWDGFSMTVVS
ncbi:Catechol O-methyltransferase [Castellaniella defragrans]